MELQAQVLTGLGPEAPHADASCAFLHYVALLAILPEDNRSLRDAAQPGHQQWQSPTNLLTETNLFDMAVQDMDLKSCRKKTYIKKKKNR